MSYTQAVSISKQVNPMETDSSQQDDSPLVTKVLNFDSNPLKHVALSQKSMADADTHSLDVLENLRR